MCLIVTGNRIVRIVASQYLDRASEDEIRQAAT